VSDPRGAQWQRASELFERALDLAEQHRAAWLDAECAGDVGLRELIERWLAADAASGDFLEQALPAEFLSEPADDAADASGTRFGPYRALQLIGSGGMGEVWLAAREDDDFEQQVAIKRLLYPTPELVQRFRRERRVLASLEHPHIARLIDGGVAGDGLPYFVMEYVPGEPITVYCDTHALPLRERLALFLQVCDAVQFAHRNLVVHRDLKPTNILVGADRRAKLLDFGIAKVIESTESDPATVTIVQRMTPDYAAPEQMRGDHVTIATDVYALGILLCELIAGDRPYRFGRRRQDLEQLLETTSVRAPSAIAAQGSGQAHAWARALRGDLDRITLRAIAREPERRYATAQALADDVRRHLDGRPIAARGDDAWYRVRKFVGRNRAASVAVGIAVGALLAATAISLQQAQRANEQARRAEAEKAFVLGILDANDPNDTQGKGETLTARQILDRAAARIDKDLADQPAVRAELYDEIGNLYWDYGQYARALPLFQQSAKLAQEMNLPAAQRVPIMIDLGVDQRMLRKIDQARATFEGALEFVRSNGGEDSELGLRVRGEYVTTLVYAGRYDEAEAEARRVLATTAARHPKDGTDYADALATLAYAVLSRHHYPEAVELEQKLLELNQRLHPEIHSGVSTSLNDLGFALLGAGRLAEAEVALRRALAIHEKLLGKAHPHYAGTQNTLARVLDHQGHFEDARVQLDQALAARARAVGDDANVLDSHYRAIALNALHRGDVVAADAAARRALELDLSAYDKDHPEVAQSQLVLAHVLIEAGRRDEAEPVLRGTIAIADATFGSPSDVSGYARALLARLLAQNGHADVAMPLFEQALADLRAAVGERHFEYADALTWKGEAQLAAGQVEAAQATLRGAVTAAQAAYPQDSPLAAASSALLLRANASRR
jgi:serine/threonine-protein kinase